MVKVLRGTRISKINPIQKSLSRLIIATVTVTSFTSLYAQKLNLKDFEQKAISQSKKVQLSDQTNKLYQIKNRQKYGKLIPSLSFDQSYARKDPEPAAGPSNPVTSSSLSLSLKVQDPWNFANEGRQVDLIGEKSRLERQVYQNETLDSVRARFYRILFFQEQMKLKTEFLTILERVHQETKRRYESGLTHLLDFQKSGLARDQAIRNKQMIESQLKTELRSFQLYVSGETNETLPDVEGTIIPDLQAVDQILKTGFFDHFKADSTPSILLQKTAVSSTLLAEEQSKLHMIPDLTLRVEKPVDHHASDGITYKAGLSWALFNGGRDYYSWREKKTEHEKQSLIFEDQKTQWKIKFEELKSTLVQDIEELKSQTSAVKTWEDMIALSTRRYSSGLTGYLELSNDLEKYTQQKESLTGQQGKFWKNLSAFTSHVGDPDSFYQFIASDRKN